MNRKIQQTITALLLICIVLATQWKWRGGNQLQLPFRRSQPIETFVIEDLNLPKENERDPAVLESKLYRTLFHVEITCRHHIRVGNTNDGGWDVCTSEPFAVRAPCIVYSFGRVGDWSFDDAMAEEHGCVVRSFDPSLGLNDHQRGPLQWFYNLGLGGHTFHKKVPKKDGKGDTVLQLYSFGTFLKLYEEKSSTIDFLKFDIEGDEYDALDGMFKTDSLKLVKQIALEFHVWGNREKSVWEKLNKLNDLGFRIWNFHENAVCRRKALSSATVSACVKVQLLNTNFLESEELRNQIGDQQQKQASTRGFVVLDLPPIPNPSSANALTLLNRLMRMREVTCPHHTKFGADWNNAGWSVCTTPPIAPSSSCLVYSFFSELLTEKGAKYWTFEDGITNMFPCTIHSFVSHELDLPYNRSPLIKAHTGDLKTKSLDYFLKQTGDQGSVIDILNIGPYKEIEIFQDLFAENTGIDRVKQLLIQLPTLAKDADEALPQIKLLQTIKDRGFIKWASHTFPPGRGASKPLGPYSRLFYLNKRFL